MSARSTPPASWFSVTAGACCVGHVLNRGKSGWEAFDRDDRSVGIFSTPRAAVDALERAIAELQR